MKKKELTDTEDSLNFARQLNRMPLNVAFQAVKLHTHVQLRQNLVHIHILNVRYSIDMN